jgi:hypothetical protein
MEDLERYLEEFVEPTIADFARDPSSVRLAFIGCVTVFHSVDYLAHPRRPAILRQQWRQKSKAFRTVDEIAHAFKHVKATGNPSPLRAKEVVSVSGAFDRAVFDVSTFDGGFVTLVESDPTTNVLTVVREAAAFAREQLAALGARPTGSR